MVCTIAAPQLILAALVPELTASANNDLAHEHTLESNGGSRIALRGKNNLGRAV